MHCGDGGKVVNLGEIPGNKPTYKGKRMRMTNADKENLNNSINSYNNFFYDMFLL